MLHIPARPSVRCLSAVSAPCPLCGRPVSALCRSCVRSVSALCPPCVRSAPFYVHSMSALCPLCTLLSGHAARLTLQAVRGSHLRRRLSALPVAPLRRQEHAARSGSCAERHGPLRRRAAAAHARAGVQTQGPRDSPDHGGGRHGCAVRGLAAAPVLCRPGNAGARRPSAASAPLSLCPPCVRSHADLCCNGCTQINGVGIRNCSVPHIILNLLSYPIVSDHISSSCILSPANLS